MQNFLGKPGEYIVTIDENNEEGRSILVDGQPICHLDIADFESTAEMEATADLLSAALLLLQSADSMTDEYVENRGNHGQGQGQGQNERIRVINHGNNVPQNWLNLMAGLDKAFRN